MLDLILENNNRRRQSLIDTDKIYMEHWNTCHKTFNYKNSDGDKPCSVFGLCNEGQRLDRLCSDYQEPEYTALDVFCAIAEIMALRAIKQNEIDMQEAIKNNA